jgi:hypothetical protein
MGMLNVGATHFTLARAQSRRRAYRSIFFWIPLIALFTQSIGNAHATWWSALFKTGSATARVKTVAKSAKELLSEAPVGSRALSATEGNLVATTATGTSTVLLAAGASAVALEPAALMALKKIKLYIDEVDLADSAQLREVLKQVEEEAVLVRVDGSTGIIRTVREESKVQLIGELRPGIFHDFDNPMTPEVRYLLERPFDSDNARVVSFLDSSDADISAALSNSILGAHIPAPLLEADAIHLVEQLTRKTIFVFSHIEDGYLVARGPNGAATGRVSVASVEDAAQRAGSSIIVLGCDSALCSKSAGYLSAVNGVDVAEGLRNAVDEPTIGAVLSKLSDAGSGILLRPKWADAEHHLVVQAARLNGTTSTTNKIAVHSVRVSSASARLKSTTGASASPTPLGTIVMTYVVGLIFLFKGRKLLFEWEEDAYPLPKYSSKPIVYLSSIAIRCVAVGVLTPFAFVCSLLIIALPVVFFISALIDVAAWFSLIPILLGVGWLILSREEMAEVPWGMRAWTACGCCAIATSISAAILLAINELSSFAPPGSLPYELFGGAFAASLAGPMFWVIYQRSWIPSNIIAHTATSALTAADWIVARISR